MKRTMMTLMGIFAVLTSALADKVMLRDFMPALAYITNIDSMPEPKDEQTKENVRDLVWIIHSVVETLSMCERLHHGTFKIPKSDEVSHARVIEKYSRLYPDLLDKMPDVACAAALSLEYSTKKP